MTEKLDFIGVPSTNSERTRRFYVETLGLKPDPKARFEFWVEQTCFASWEPGKMAFGFEPQKLSHLALGVDAVAESRSELEAKGVEFEGDIFDTGVCHMALFNDPDGNALMLHHRYAPVD